MYFSGMKKRYSGKTTARYALFSPHPSLPDPQYSHVQHNEISSNNSEKKSVYWQMNSVELSSYTRLMQVP